MAGNRRDDAVTSVLYKRFIYLNIYIYVQAKSCVFMVFTIIIVLLSPMSEIILISIVLLIHLQHCFVCVLAFILLLY